MEDIVAYESAADLMLYSGWVGGTVFGGWFGGSVDAEAAGVGVIPPPLSRPRLADDPGPTGLDRGRIGGRSRVIATMVLPTAWQITGAATVASLVGIGSGE